MKIRSKLFPLLLSIIVLAAGIKAFRRDLTALKAANNITQWYVDTFDKKEKEIRTELLAHIDVSEQEWNDTHQTLEKKYFQDCTETTEQELAHKSLDKKIIDAALSVLENEKIKTALEIETVTVLPNNEKICIERANGKTLTIACGNKSIEADAATDQYTILVEPETLLVTHATKSEIKATIAHEIIHIIHQDDYHVYCLDQLCTKKKKLRKKFKKLFAQIKGRWERLQEERADVLSGLIDLEYATAHKNHFKRHMPAHESIKATSTHPTEKQRFEYMNMLVDVMQNNRFSC